MNNALNTDAILWLLRTEASSKDESAVSEGRIAMAVPQASAFSWDDLTAVKPVPPSTAGRATPQVQTDGQLLRSKTTMWDNTHVYIKLYITTNRIVVDVL